MRVLFLDIETSWNHDDTNPICWMTSCAIYDNGEKYLFRYPEDVCKFYLKIKGDVVTYIHKAGFDLSYLIPYFDKYFKGEVTYLNVDSHDYYFWRKGRYTFKDSWKLANCSLEKWGEMYQIEDRKKVGTYDYDKIRYQDTDLTDTELDYQFYDVIALAECMEQELKFHNTDYEHVPLTSTGYIRRELKQLCNNNTYRRTYFLPIDVGLYRSALNSFCGGYTHLNRNITNLLQKGNIYYRDFQSHYPTMLRQRKYPLGKQRELYNVSSIDELLAMCKSGDFSVVCTLKITDATLKGGVKSYITMPLLQESKVLGYPSILADNGRIIQAKGTFQYSLDNIRLKLIKEQYDFGKVEIVRAYLIRNKSLPKEIADFIDNLFIEKCRLKPIKNKYPLEYDLSKKRLNGVFGLICTNPLKHAYKDFDLNIMLQKDDEEFFEYYYTMTKVKLNQYFRSRSHFLPYTIGVFCTSYATEELFKYIKLIGYDKVLYVDTDSIIYFSDPSIEARISTEVDKCKKAYVKVDGKKIYYYDFELEHICTEFKGEHAKCYGLVYNGELHLTIAGVPEKTYYNGRFITREEELVDLDNLDDEFEFKINTGTSSYYYNTDPQILNIDGHEVHTAGGCIIRKLDSKKLSKGFEEE